MGMKNTDCRMFDFYSDCMEFFLINSLGEIPRTLLKARRKETSLEYPTFSEIAFIVSDLSDSISQAASIRTFSRMAEKEHPSS